MTGLVAALALSLTLAPAQAEMPPLKWKLKEGDTFFVRTTLKSKQTITIAAQDQEQTTTHARVDQFKVTKAAADGYTMERTAVQSATESGSLVDGLEDFDKAVVGAPLTLTLDGNLKVKKADGVTDMAKKLTAGNPAFKPLADGLFSEAAVKKGAEDLFARGPKKAVKVGEEWKATEVTPMPAGPLTSRLVFKYAKSKDGTEEVTFTGKAKLAPPEKKTEGALSKVVKSTVKSDKHAGSFQFDSKTGRLKQGDEEFALTGELTYSYSGSEIDAEMKAAVTTKVEVFDKNPVKP